MYYELDVPGVTSRLKVSAQAAVRHRVYEPGETFASAGIRRTPRCRWKTDEHRRILLAGRGLRLAARRRRRGRLGGR